MSAPSDDPHPRMLEAFGPLRHAEQVLLSACERGEIARVGLQLPDQPDVVVALRAGFLAYLVRSGLGLARGQLQLMGAYVEGRLELADAVMAGSLWFFRCRFDSALRLDDARIGGSLTLSGCHLPRLLADRCTIAADLQIGAGCTIEDELRLRQARIGGDFEATRLDLRGRGDTAPPRRALLADGLQVGGDLRLRDRLHAVGELCLAGARIGGDLVLGGHLTGNLVGSGPDGGGRAASLRLDRADIAGSVRAERGLGIAGQVSLCRARVGGDVDLTGADFDRLGDATWGEGAMLLLDRSRIEGTLVLRDQQNPLVGASFVDARVGALADDATTWGERLLLDGFEYGRFGEGAPLDTAFRIDWLERQHPAHLQQGLRVQPWRRLAKVLRRMGHEDRARSVDLRREQWRRRVGRVGEGLPAALRWLPRAGHGLFGLLAGYGYRPGRLLAWAAVVWLVCGAVYWVAAGATDAPFEALAYSLECLLPLVQPSAALAWSIDEPWTEALQGLASLESAFGWLATLLFVAAWAGWIDREPRR